MNHTVAVQLDESESESSAEDEAEADEADAPEPRQDRSIHAGDPSGPDDPADPDIL